MTGLLLTTRVAAAFAALSLGALAALAQGKSGVERLYAFNCGVGHSTDQSQWSPGVNVNKEWDVADNCYLIKHGPDWMIWDTGIADSVASQPDGVPAPRPGGIAWRKPITLAAQLEVVGIKPSDIKFVSVSHTHGDHSGNVEMFPQAMLLVQTAEYDWPNPDKTPRFKPGHPVTKLNGDHDVFGDGSVVIISTPGHTPGHQSLLVRLPKTGVVILGGDVAHFRENWDNRRVPGFNTSKEQSEASMQKVADLMARYNAQLWINHDKAQSDATKRPPEYYE